MMNQKTPFEPIFENPPMRMKACRHGTMLYNMKDVYIGRSFDVYGEYAESELSFLAQFIKPGAIVFDIGANIGAHTIFFAQRVGPEGRVISFEPQRPVFQTLCANVALNALGNVITFHAGAGEQPGTAVVPLPNYNDEGNFGGVSLAGQSGGEPVQIMTLDQIGIPALSLIKIDVEGMELEVLKGATQTIAKHKPVLYVENDRKEQSPELLTHIFAMGYRAYWHLPTLYSADNFAGNPDNSFPGIVSVNLLCVPATVNQNIVGLNEVQAVDEFPI